MKHEFFLFKKCQKYGEKIKTSSRDKEKHIKIAKTLFHTRAIIEFFLHT